MPGSATALAVISFDREETPVPPASTPIAIKLPTEKDVQKAADLLQEGFDEVEGLVWRVKKVKDADEMAAIVEPTPTLANLGALWILGGTLDNYIHLLQGMRKELDELTLIRVNGAPRGTVQERELASR